MSIEKLLSLCKEVPQRPTIRGVYWVIMGLSGLLFAFAAFGLIITVVPFMRADLTESANMLNRTFVGCVLAGVIAGIGVLLAYGARAIGRALFLPGDWLYILVTGMGKPDSVRNPINTAARQLSRIDINSAPPSIVLAKGLSHELLSGIEDARSEHLDSAIRCYRNLIEIYDPSDDLKFEIASCLFQAGAYDEALAAIEILITQNPTDVQYAMLQAQALEKRHFNERAISSWQHVQELGGEPRFQELAKKSIHRLQTMREVATTSLTSESVTEAFTQGKLKDYIIGSPTATLSALRLLPERKWREYLKQGVFQNMPKKEVQQVLDAIPGGVSDPGWQMVHTVFDRAVHVPATAFAICGIIVIVGVVAINVLFWCGLDDFAFLGIIITLASFLGAMGTGITAVLWKGSYDALFGTNRPTCWRRRLKMTALAYPIVLALSIFFSIASYRYYHTLSQRQSSTGSNASEQQPDRHFARDSIVFDYPSALTTPDKTKFDVEKVREMLRPSGVEILTIMMSADMSTMIQVARTKRDTSIDALYEEKSSLADEINKGGVNVMGYQYTKFTVDKTQLSGNVQALSEYGEKANGEVAVALEFLNEGYVYTLMFIYKNRSHMQSGAKDREKVVQSVKIKSKD